MIRKKMEAILILLITAAFLVGTAIRVATAQEGQFPSKPIKLLIQEGPGGTLDVPYRTLAKAATQILGQPVVCMNAPGGGGTRVLSTLLKENPDGYTLGTVAAGSLVSALSTEKLDYYIPNDFTPVIKIQGHPLPVSVRKDAPWKTWQELIKFAREHKKEVKIGVWGSRSLAWLALQQIEKKEKVNFNYVPFSSAGDGVAWVIGGHADGFTGSSGIMYSKTGELKTLLLFADERIDILPGVPTAKELYGLLGVGITGGFSGILAPKGLPSPVLTKLHEAFKKAKDDPDYLKLVKEFYLLISYKNPEEFKKEITEDYEEIKEILGRLK